MTDMPVDPEPIAPAPLGWCAECLRDDALTAAATLLDGTSLCRPHARPLLRLKTRHD